VSANASAVVHAVKFVNSFARHQQVFDIAAKPTDVDSNFLSYPATLFLFQFRPKCNHLICSLQWLSSANLIKIRSAAAKRKKDRPCPGPTVLWAELRQIQII